MGHLQANVILKLPPELQIKPKAVQLPKWQATAIGQEYLSRQVWIRGPRHLRSPNPRFSNLHPGPHNLTKNGEG